MKGAKTSEFYGPGSIVKIDVSWDGADELLAYGMPAEASAYFDRSMAFEFGVISKDGNVIDAVVIRSQPLLDQAALDAVRLWKFTPTTLNGQPVEVKMTVTVNFTLR